LACEASQFSFVFYFGADNNEVDEVDEVDEDEVDEYDV
jgi:hypothetical protein